MYLRHVLVLCSGLALPACGDKDDTGAVDADGDGYTIAEDCNDASSAIHPGAEERCNGLDDDCDGLVDDEDPGLSGATTWYLDQDGDGYGDVSTAVVACEQPDDHVDEPGDCNDYVATIHMGAPEWCDGVDNDCDGATDEADAEDASAWYPDVDGDGYGELGATPEPACAQPSGMSAEATDCDDGDPAIHPGAPELCDEVDSDCDGITADDESTDALTWYADADGDGYGDVTSPTDACEQPSGHVSLASDCDDGDPAIHPGAAERCDGVDSDCDGELDEDDAEDAPTWYADGDGDGYGDPTAGAPACSQPTGAVADGGDCDDGDPAIHPGATELCDAVDSDCDGITADDESTDATLWYADGDADGYGDAGVSRGACSQPSGYVADNTDCNDGRADAHPGANEWCDGVDNDCDGSTDEADAIDVSTWYADGDGDGWGVSGTSVATCNPPPSFVIDSGDCNDGDSAIFPGADEWCDGVDNDCDGATDEEDALDPSTWYADGDGDGYGDAASTATACTAPRGYGADATDCDDGDPATFPGADERCDGVDTDCDGVLDEDDALDAPSWYLDGDGDGYGLDASAVVACTAPSGHEASGGDCDDSDPGVHPGATETCDAVDSDCDGSATIGAVDGDTWYSDTDGDGWGDPGSPVVDCTQPGGTVVDATDCDDSDPAVFPGADEYCNGYDDDCDGSIDVGAVDAGTYYTDADGDGYGDPASPVEACGPGSGLVADNTDCDDTEPLFTTDCSGCTIPTPYSGSLTLSGSTASSDAQSFCASYNVIEGDLSLDATDLVDLEDLECLCQVDGGVTINDNTALTSLSGLRYLASIGGSLSVDNNDALPDLAGLDSLVSVGGDVEPDDSNALLTDFTGLETLETVGGSLGTSNNLDPAGLDSLSSVGGDMKLALGASPDCTALGNLESVGGYLTIADAPSFLGLEALESVGDYFVLERPTAADLQGLENLRSVGTDFVIHNTTSLRDLTGLDSLETIGEDLTLGNVSMDDVHGTALTTVHGIFIYGSTLIDLTGLEGLTSIDGDVTISGSTLTSFTGLDNVTLVDGWLQLYNSDVTSLDGWGGLTTISEELWLETADVLTSFVGLDALATVGGSITVKNSDDLVDFGGLGNLTSIGDDITLQGNADLVDFTGLDNLTSIGGDIYCQSCSSLSSFNGLNALTTVGGRIYLTSCGGVGSYAGLWSLTTVGGSVDAGSSVHLTGLENLVSVGGSIEGRGDLTPLSNLESVGSNATFYYHEGTAPMPALHTVGGTLSLYSPEVTEVDGFETLTSVGGLEFTGYHDTVENITGFNALTSIGGDLRFGTLFDLYEVDGLSNLTTVDGDFTIYNCTMDRAWDDLTSLTAVGGDVYVGYNLYLYSVSGLYNIESVGGDFTCTNNGLTAAQCQYWIDEIGEHNIAGTITIDE